MLTERGGRWGVRRLTPRWRNGRDVGGVASFDALLDADQPIADDLS
jgi:hypothetical protein